MAGRYGRRPSGAPQLIVEFFRKLSAGNCDVVVGVRASHGDPRFTRLGSWLYWSLYRRLICDLLP
jgi:hypothetical protein